MKNIKNLIIPVCILLASCNQTYYKYYGPYLKVGSDIELIKSRIILDEEMGNISSIRADDYLKELEIIKLKMYNISYEAKKPILMPFNGRWMTYETWEE
jgi:hypothetical protein